MIPVLDFSRPVACLLCGQGIPVVITGVAHLDSGTLTVDVDTRDVLVQVQDHLDQVHSEEVR